MIFRDRFKDKVIILTGAARGIGRATALRAAREGAVMVLADRCLRYRDKICRVADCGQVPCENSRRTYAGRRYVCP